MYIIYMIIIFKIIKGKTDLMVKSFLTLHIIIIFRRNEQENK